MKTLKTSFVLFIFCCSMSYGQSKHVKDTRLLSTLKFIIEQQNTLDNIQAKFPEISIEANIANQEFHKSYSKALNNIHIEARNILKVDFRDYVANIVNQHNDQLLKKEMSEKEASSFIHQVKSRANGFLASRYLEVIKMYNTKDLNLLTYKN